jgi:hypothetical protein
MSTPQQFETELMRLDPDDSLYMPKVMDLVKSVSESQYAALVEPIFKFFEANPLADTGAPGTLVHLVERFYPSYKGRLLASLPQRPSCTGVDMVNRILNSTLPEAERAEYMVALEEVSNQDGLPKMIRGLAAQYIERRRQLDAQR